MNLKNLIADFMKAESVRLGFFYIHFSMNKIISTVNACNSIKA